MHSQMHAPRAGSAVPENGEALAGGTAQGSKIQTVADGNHRSDGLAFEQVPRSYAKRLADVTAKLAIRGFSLYPLDGDQLLIAQWGLSKALPNIDAAERFLHRIGGAHE